MSNGNGKTELQTIASQVPPAIKEAIEKIAADEDRTVSKIVRRLLEESPAVQAALKQAAKQKA